MSKRKLHPDTIVLGGVELTRQLNKASVRLNVWICVNHWNILSLHNNGWRFRGGPLKHDWADDAYYPTPKEAYIGFIVKQILKLQQQFDIDRDKCLDALEATGTSPEEVRGMLCHTTTGTRVLMGDTQACKSRTTKAEKMLSAKIARHSTFCGYTEPLVGIEEIAQGSVTAEDIYSVKGTKKASKKKKTAKKKATKKSKASVATVPVSSLFGKYNKKTTQGNVTAEDPCRPFQHLEVKKTRAPKKEVPSPVVELGETKA